MKIELTMDEYQILGDALGAYVTKKQEQGKEAEKLLNEAWKSVKKAETK